VLGSSPSSTGGIGKALMIASCGMQRTGSLETREAKGVKNVKGETRPVMLQRPWVTVWQAF
jgi:hypothetical protein